VQCSELQIDRRLTRVRNVFEQVSWICSKVLIGVSELSPFSEAQEDVTKSRKEFLQLARIRSTTLALVQVESSSYAKLVQLIAEHVEAIIQCRQIEIGSNLATNSTLDSSSACASVLLISRFEIMSTTLAPSPSTTASPVPRETKASDQHTPLTEPSQASPASLPQVRCELVRLEFRPEASGFVAKQIHMPYNFVESLVRESRPNLRTQQSVMLHKLKLLFSRAHSQSQASTTACEHQH
jgi:hypothetical protein